MIFTCQDCGGEMKSIFDGTLFECSSCQRVHKTQGNEAVRTTTCRGCGEKIVFMPTKTGKLIPVDADTFDNSILFDAKKHTAHFATCPQAKEFRKDKRS
mgnify:CR=1 FL=1